MSLDQRVRRLEEIGPKKSNDVVIEVRFVETMTTPDGTKEVLLPATYDPISWNELAPARTGKRIIVRYPREMRSENVSREDQELG
jgi:hypothetical protein